MGILGKEVSALLRNPKVRDAIHEVLDARVKHGQATVREVSVYSTGGHLVSTVSVRESGTQQEPGEG